MFESTFLLLKLFDVVKQIDGRKKLQKTVHLLGCAGLDIPYKYEYHYYGPYSSQLQEEVNLLVHQGLLEEIYNDSTYSYRITDEGLTFKESLEGSGHFRVDINVGLAELMMRESSQLLEMVSTYAFLVKSGYDREAAKKKALELKPKLKHLSEQSFTFCDQNILN